MSERPSFALLFDLRAESCRSCSNSFGASDDVRGQGGRAEQKDDVYLSDQLL